MFSIVIPCYDDGDLLVAQLEALAGQRCPEPWEVVIADNGSEGGVAALEPLVAPFRDDIDLRVVDASDAPGAGHARNVGVAAARGDKIGFLDADDVAAEGWVAAMAAALDEHVVVASRWDVERLNTPEVAAGRSDAQSRGVRSYVHPPYLDHAGGCGLGVHRDAFQAIGGFDPSFRLLEDTDLTWRLQLAGHALAFAPDAVVHIRFRPGLHGSFRQAFGYGRYNVMLYKRYRAHGMPRLRVRDGVASLVTLVLRLPHLFDPERRAAYVRALGFRLGRIRGSIEHGVWGL
ncbi:MAG: glycosyltransferase [Trueperaceae bacterium]